MMQTRSILSANEFSLSIALVVFVMITLLLIAILVLLCISKSFRAFFFREHIIDEQPRQREEDSNNDAPIEQTDSPAVDPEPQTPAETAPKRRRKKPDPFGVPTVPLILAEPISAPRAPKKRATRTTVGDDSEQSEKSTYTTRPPARSNVSKKPRE